jgi:hypothetical protein
VVSHVVVLLGAMLLQGQWRPMKHGTHDLKSGAVVEAHFELPLGVRNLDCSSCLLHHVHVCERLHVQGKVLTDISNQDIEINANSSIELMCSGNDWAGVPMTLDLKRSVFSAKLPLAFGMQYMYKVGKVWCT